MPDPETTAPGSIHINATSGSAVVWDAALWHQGGINRDTGPRWTVIAYYQRAWIKGKTDSVRLLPPEAVKQMSDEAKQLVGIMPDPPDYSEVKALSPREIAALTLEKKKVLGFAVY